MSEATEGRGRKVARRVVGATFVLTGAFKLLLPVLIPTLRPGAPDFPQMLVAAGVPFPALVGLAVPLLEVVGGIALLADALLPLACLLLAGDMIGALVTVGVPGTFLGRPVVAGGVTIGDEPWRVPLEAALLLLCAWLGALWRPSPRRFLAVRES